MLSQAQTQAAADPLFRIEIGRYQRDMRSKKRLMTLPRGGRAS